MTVFLTAILACNCYEFLIQEKLANLSIYTAIFIKTNQGELVNYGENIRNILTRTEAIFIFSFKINIQTSKKQPK